MSKVFRNYINLKTRSRFRFFHSSLWKQVSRLKDSRTRQNHWLIAGRSVGWSGGVLIGWSVRRGLSQSVSQLVGQAGFRSVGWSLTNGQLVGQAGVWLVGRLVCFSNLSHCRIMSGTIRCCFSFRFALDSFKLRKHLLARMVWLVSVDVISVPNAQPFISSSCSTSVVNCRHSARNANNKLTF